MLCEVQRQRGALLSTELERCSAKYRGREVLCEVQRYVGRSTALFSMLGPAAVLRYLQSMHSMISALYMPCTIDTRFEYISIGTSNVAL